MTLEPALPELHDLPCCCPYHSACQQARPAFFASMYWLSLDQHCQQEQQMAKLSDIQADLAGHNQRAAGYRF